MFIGRMSSIKRKLTAGESMNTNKMLLIAMILVSLPSAVDAKPVIVGYGGNFDLAALEEYNISNYTVHQQIDAFSADIPESIIDELYCEKKIRYIEEDILVGIEKKEVQSSQIIDWGVSDVNAPSAWNNSTGIGIKIAIVDTGISKKHLDLDVAGGANLIGDAHNKKWDDDNGHGTHVAGIIGACNNSIGVVGVAYDSELYAVKVLDSSGNGQISDVIEGIEWAVENDMDIISLSMGTATYSQAFEDACDFAYSSDVLLVAAAGNSGDGDLTTNDVEYPAKFDSVIAVSAIDSNDIAPIWSSDGAEVELSAPGVSIYSTFLNDGYATESGTSMATPFVSGVAALVKSENPSLNSSELRSLLCSNAIDLGDTGRDSVYGFGLVRA
jgi:minor extracellular protease Epr